MTSPSYPLMAFMVCEVSEDNGATWTEVTGQLLSHSFNREVDDKGAGMASQPGTMTLAFKDTRPNVWAPSILRTNQLVRLRGRWSEKAVRFTGRVDSVGSSEAFDPGTARPIVTETVQISDNVKPLANTPVKQLISQEDTEILPGTQVWYLAVQQLMKQLPAGITYSAPEHKTRTVYQLGERYNADQQVQNNR